MVRKIFYFIISLIAVLFLPWPLALGAIAVIAVGLKPIYSTAAAALLFDWAYGASGHLMIGLLTLIAVWLAILIGRQFIRWDQLKNDY